MRIRHFRDALITNRVPSYTLLDGSQVEAGQARLSNKDIATAEHLATLMAGVNSVLVHR